MLTISLKDIPALKLADLKRECKNVGLITTGNKTELAERLTNFILNQYQTQYASMSRGNPNSSLISSVGNVNQTEIPTSDNFQYVAGEIHKQIFHQTSYTTNTHMQNMKNIDEEELEEKLLDSSNEDIGTDNIDLITSSTKVEIIHNNTAKDFMPKNNVVPPNSADQSNNTHMIQLNEIQKMPNNERAAKRSEKFNGTSSNISHVPFQSDEKKLVRAKRFGLPVKAEALATKSNTLVNPTKLTDVKKQRALRFGLNPAAGSPEIPYASKDKKSLRALRFGLI